MNNLSANLVKDKTAAYVAVNRATPTTLQSALSALVERVEPGPLSGAMLRVFADLARLLEVLDKIEINLRQDCAPEKILQMFNLVHKEARGLLDFTETCALQTEGINEIIFDAIDGTNYAISFELGKVFKHELAELSDLSEASLMQAKFERAHALLRNCFQQSTVALAQALDPAFDGTQLFDDLRNRLLESVSLCEDLQALIQLARRVEEERDRHSITILNSRLRVFRDASLHYLMYKDRETCKRLIQEIMTPLAVREVVTLTHHFSCYLKALLEQVRMRAVLANQHLDFSATQQQEVTKPCKRSKKNKSATAALKN